MTGNLISNLHVAGSAAVAPEVGMGATVCHWKDRNAATVVAVRLKRDGSVKEIDIRGDIVTRTDSNGMSDAQSYTYAPAPEDVPAVTWRLDGKGQWRALHRDGVTGNLRMAHAKYGAKLALGVRDEFYDYSF
jgi:hypothetical protein